MERGWTAARPAREFSKSWLAQYSNRRGTVIEHFQGSPRQGRQGDIKINPPRSFFQLMAFFSGVPDHRHFSLSPGCSVVPAWPAGFGPGVGTSQGRFACRRHRLVAQDQDQTKTKTRTRHWLGSVTDLTVWVVQRW